MVTVNDLFLQTEPIENLVTIGMKSGLKMANGES